MAGGTQIYVFTSEQPSQLLLVMFPTAKWTSIFPHCQFIEVGAALKSLRCEHFIADSTSKAAFKKHGGIWLQALQSAVPSVGTLRPF